MERFEFVMIEDSPEDRAGEGLVMLNVHLLIDKKEKNLSIQKMLSDQLSKVFNSFGSCNF
jgi:hypothetical protein